jgi:hypothetical protein
LNELFLDGPGLRIPWQTDSIKNALDYLNDQERNDITYEAQVIQKNSIEENENDLI